MVKKSNKKKVLLQVDAEPNADVYVAGTFNNWNPGKNRLSPQNGGFTTSVSLPKGIYEYKFVINGSWIPDPKCNAQVTSEMGTVNSVLVVE